MSTETTSSERHPIAGVDFDFIVHADVIKSIVQWSNAGQKQYIVLVNPHSVMNTRRNPRMRAAASEAGLCLPDGVGVILAAKLLGYGRQHRVTGPSLLLTVCEAGLQKGLRHFFYGGAEGVAETLRDRLMKLYPELQVAGVYCPPFGTMSPEEDKDAVRRINESRPDVVWVGLGAPKQEIWMAEHRGQINASTMIGVGAAFDFHSGNVKWAPRWVRRAGLEWAHRLLMNPARMWRRNLDSPLFLLVVARQSLRTLMQSAVRFLRSKANVPSTDVTENVQPEGTASLQRANFSESMLDQIEPSATPSYV